jgi:hypothetical protein
MKLAIGHSAPKRPVSNLRTKAIHQIAMLIFPAPQPAFTNKYCETIASIDYNGYRTPLGR